MRKLKKIHDTKWNNSPITIYKIFHEYNPKQNPLSLKYLRLFHSNSATYQLPLAWMRLYYPLFPLFYFHLYQLMYHTVMQEQSIWQKTRQDHSHCSGFFLKHTARKNSERLLKNLLKNHQLRFCCKYKHSWRFLIKKNLT